MAFTIKILLVTLNKSHKTIVASNMDCGYIYKAKEMGAVTIKCTKKHIERPPKLNKDCNLVRYIFVVPFKCNVNHGMLC